MRKAYLRLCVLAIALLILGACEHKYTGYRPYTWDYYQVNKVQMVRERVYNARGALTSATTTRFSARGDIEVEYKVADNGTDSVETVYLYNEEGELSGIQSKDYKYSCKTNAAGNLTREDFITGKDANGDNLGYYKEYIYSDDGRITRRKSHEYGKDPYYTNYTYWPSGKRMSFQTDNPDGSHITYNCDSLGNIISKDFVSKKDRVTASYSMQYEYDSLGNWTSKKVYDNRGKLIESALRTNYYFVKTPVTDVKKTQYVAQTRSLSYVDGVKYRLTHFGFTDKAPDYILMAIILILSLILFFVVLFGYAAEEGIFDDYLGEKDLDTGMRRTWVFNARPYMRTLLIFLMALASFVIVLLALLIIGLLLWALFWIVKIVFIVLVWIGWILLVIGLLGVFFSDEEKGFGCGSAIVGGILVAMRHLLERWGNTMVDWAEAVLDNLNLTTWTIEFFSNYWDIMLLTVGVPVAFGLSVAILIMLITLILRLLEFGIMRAYNIRRSCPSCGGREFDYIVGGKAHPVNLYPGTYGIFHQTSPVTGEQLPTMLFNGKARLVRKCRHCHAVINKEKDNVMGTEIHLGIVGSRSSGKSYMLYSALNQIRKAYGDDFQQVDAEMNTRLLENVERISRGDGIQTAVRDLYKAVQVLLSPNGRKIPYHLFFYDVAGETFNSQSLSSTKGMDFYRNVQTIFFVLDPTMVDLDLVAPSGQFATWIGKHHSDNEKYDVEGAVSMCTTILQQAGRKTKDIDLVFVCTKGDLGYMKASGFPDNLTADSTVVRQFMTDAVGLVNVVNIVETSFRSVTYAVVSTKDGRMQELNQVMADALRKKGLNLQL